MIRRVAFIFLLSLGQRWGTVILSQRQKDGYTLLVKRYVGIFIPRSRSLRGVYLVTVVETKVKEPPPRSPSNSTTARMRKGGRLRVQSTSV